MKNILDLIRKPELPLEPGGIDRFNEADTLACPSCRRFVEKKKLQSNLMVCPACGHHFRLGAGSRIRLVADKGSFSELFGGITSRDFLEFPGYKEKLKAAKAASGLNEAVLCGVADIGKHRAAVFAMDPNFMMGSMGSAVGEKLTRLFEYAAEKSLPVVGFSASGGARMQEGILSLMQMAKVSGAVEWHGKHRNLYISVLTDPTTGGVSASFAALGDIILSEPGALVGFAGKRVIEQTTGERLPEGFQQAEYVLKSGFIDRIVPRKELKSTLGHLLGMHEGRPKR
jgi:acetyl-CoA carboxylase carboxyl transferase subunit beta